MPGLASTHDAAPGRPPAAREQAILDAALALLAEVGYDRLTMDAVAARAHSSKATIYRHWPGKAELVTDALNACLVADHRAPDTGSLRQDLVEYVERVHDVLAGRQGDLLLAVAFAARTDAALAEQMHERLMAKPSVVGAILEQARARGEAVALGAGERADDVAPALLLLRLLGGLPLDRAYLRSVVDDVLVPLLSAP